MNTHLISTDFTAIAFAVLVLGSGSAAVAADPRPTLQGLQDQINALTSQLNELKSHAAVGAYLTAVETHDNIPYSNQQDFQSPYCDSGDKAMGVSYQVYTNAYTAGQACVSISETGPSASLSQWGIHMFNAKEVEYNNNTCSGTIMAVDIATVCLDFAPAH